MMRAQGSKTPTESGPWTYHPGRGPMAGHDSERGTHMSSGEGAAGRIAGVTGTAGGANGDVEGTDGDAARPGASARAGHRILPHTADLALEAWAPTREQCLAEAVRALVGSAVELPAPRTPVRPSTDVVVTVDPGVPDDDLLVTVLDEVIYQMEVHERLPIDVELDEPEDPRSGGPQVRLTTVPAAEATPVGAMPKAISLHDLRFTRSGGTWHCHVTVDV